MILSFKSCIPVPADGHHGRNMWQVLTKLIKFVVDGSTYVGFSMVYNNEINFTKKEIFYVNNISRLVEVA